MYLLESLCIQIVWVTAHQQSQIRAHFQVLGHLNRFEFLQISLLLLQNLTHNIHRAAGGECDHFVVSADKLWGDEVNYFFFIGSVRLEQYYLQEERTCGKS